MYRSADIDARAKRIRLAIFDVDGVLTDGRMTYGPSGEVTKTFHVHDGHAFVLMRLADVPTAILSARDSDIVRARMRELGVRHVVQGARDKAAAFDRLLVRAGVSEAECSFMGDDVNDLPVLRRVGLAASPADGCVEARELSHLVAHAGGGLGAARELCEVILKAQEKWRI